MRIHLTVTIFLLFFSPFYHFSKAEYALLFLAIGLVISNELMNTAIEAVVDMVSPSYSKGAEAAKDIAAGAVFISAFFAAIIGIILYLDFDVLKNILRFFISYPVLFLALIVLVVLGMVFIFHRTGSEKSKIK